ncbi:hypothetical protein LRM35_15975 [Klebsiella variicola subsp. variicola]|nr:hypothetical protein LRM35_15975 [Klebsiella variicola subsp. variicola]
MVTTAIFPGRYVQGANALDECLADELLRLGQRAFIVQDPTVNKLIGSRIDALLTNKIATQSEVFVVNVVMKRLNVFRP